MSPRNSPTPRPPSSRRRIADRTLSPVEVVDAAIERIEQRNPSLTAFVFTGFDEARAARGRPSAPWPPARSSARCTACRRRSRTCSTSSRAGSRPSAACVRCATSWSTVCCLFAERIEQAGAIILGKTNSPVMGFRGTTDNYLFGPSRNPFDTDPQYRRLVGRQRRCRRGRPGAAGRGHRWRRLDPHPGLVVRRLWLQALVRAGAVRRPPERVRHDRPSWPKGRSPAPSRTPRWR